MCVVIRLGESFLALPSYLRTGGLFRKLAAKRYCLLDHFFVFMDF